MNQKGLIPHKTNKPTKCITNYSIKDQSYVYTVK